MAASRTCVFKGASTCVIKQPPVARTDWQPAADGVRTAVLSPTRRVSRRGLTQANLSPGFPGRFIPFEMQAIEFDPGPPVADFGRAFDPDEIVDLETIEQLEQI